MRSSFYGFSSIACRRRSNGFPSYEIIPGLRIQCFATTRKPRASKVPKVKPEETIEEDSDQVYIVRKGDLVGVYKNLNDCQIQVSSSVSDPSVSVYKGNSLQKDTERYITSRGLKDALYCINVADLKDNLFGKLVPCPFQQPVPTAVDVPEKDATAEPMSNEMMMCILEFDGASKGNPGQAGAGAILRSPDGTVLARVREGLGSATNNVAEYRALILGLRYALKKGYTQIQVQGDSKLICMQVQELWQTKNQNLAELCKEVKKLKQMFVSFKIQHVLRATCCSTGRLVDRLGVIGSSTGLADALDLFDWNQTRFENVTKMQKGKKKHNLLLSSLPIRHRDVILMLMQKPI